MFNPYELYRKNQAAQWRWIRNHPVKYVALNAAILAAIYGYMQYLDQKFYREVLQAETETQQD